MVPTIKIAEKVTGDMESQKIQAAAAERERADLMDNAQMQAVRDENSALNLRCLILDFEWKKWNVEHHEVVEERVASLTSYVPQIIKKSYALP